MSSSTPIAVKKK